MKFDCIWVVHLWDSIKDGQGRFVDTDSAKVWNWTVSTEGQNCGSYLKWV